MSHAKNKFVKAANQRGESDTTLFSKEMKELFEFEKEYCYDESGFTKEERFKERQSLAIKEIVIRICSLLDSELANDLEFRRRYYTEAYLQKRNNSIYYSSDAGVEIVATYHSVIGMVKLHSYSFWSFIDFFQKYI